MSKARLMVMALGLVVMSQSARAQSYQYLGMALTKSGVTSSPDGGRNRFTVHLNGTAPGTYSFGSGLLSFSFVHVTALGEELPSHAVATYRTESYVTLDASGRPTSWYLGVYSSSGAENMWAYSCGYTAVCGTTTYVMDHFSRIPQPYPGTLRSNDFGYDFRAASQNDRFTPIANNPPTVVPEPSTVALMAFGMVGLLVVRRKRSA